LLKWKLQKRFRVICEIFDIFTIVCRIHYVTLCRDSFSDVCMFSVLWLTPKSRRIIAAAQKKVASSANDVDSNFLCLCNLTKAILILGTLATTSISIFLYITTNTEMRTVWWWWIYPTRLLFKLLVCFFHWNDHIIQCLSQL